MFRHSRHPHSVFFIVSGAKECQDRYKTACTWEGTPSSMSPLAPVVPETAAVHSEMRSRHDKSHTAQLCIGAIVRRSFPCSGTGLQVHATCSYLACPLHATPQ